MNTVSEVSSLSTPPDRSSWADRARAAGIHLSLSAAVAALCAAVVFFVWYPFPYREISGGRELFMLVMAVDVVLGPLLTFAVFNKRKPMSVIRRDLSVIVVLQFAALAYGLYTVALARPVHLVFEVDRFRVVHAVEVEPSARSKAPPALQAEPWFGPSVVATRPFRDGKEQMESTFAELSGVPLADFWEPYANASTRIRERAKSIEALKAKFPQEAKRIETAVAASGLTAGQLVYMPVLSRSVVWTVLLDAQSLEPVQYFALDPF
jgi:hypothetical protein